ncbi:hypothetical protein NJH77_22575 [Serratia fonticola]|uniref:hypothetical protein n=1 Tax=Serratia TaxID=613 RepID=UPI001112C2B5|nr:MULTISPECIES: hypothetical protein [Serratia]MCO7512039.1 hypothetical protein [Serratia fonticola]
MNDSLLCKIKNRKLFFLRKSLLMIIAISTWSANATLVLTNIEARGGSGTTAYYRDYKVTWTRVAGPLDNIQIPRTVKFFGPMEFHDHTNYWCTSPGNGYYPSVQGTTCVAAQPNDTWKTLEERWINRYGATGPGIVGHQSNNPNVSECVIVAGTPVMGGAIHSQLINNGELVCTYAPPVPDPRCYIAGDILLDFGTVNKGKLIENKVINNIDLVCDLDANVSLNDATGKKGILDFKWGKATTRVNGGGLPKQVRATKGVTKLSIEAEIIGVPNVAGVFSDSYPLIVGYY